MKKRGAVLLLLIAILLTLAACNREQVSESSTAGTGNEPVLLCGVDINGMTAQQAREALEAAVDDYRLTLTADGTEVEISGSKMNLKVDNALFETYWQALEAGEDLPATVLTYRGDVLQDWLAALLDTEAENAVLNYSAEQQQFVITPEVCGRKTDVEALAAAMENAILSLAPDCSVSDCMEEIQPEMTADNEAMQAALAQANGYLDVSLTYTYNASDGSTPEIAIDRDTLVSFVVLSEDLTVSLDANAIAGYTAGMAEAYSVASYKDKFHTTGGSTLNYTVEYYGEGVDTAALAEDITACLEEGISGTRTAPYIAGNGMAYGGNYVEVNLSSQHLWVYRNGQCVVSTDFVSGSVADGHCTPNGLFAIYDKQTACYLTGENYRSYVDYWMPFYGGYGLHDASWRSSFGGQIYHYNGSHGCVNLPSSVADDVYNNISVGTKVIIYGGVTSVDPLQQRLSGTTSYKVTEDAKDFKLDVSMRYSDVKVTYHSSNTQVATVSDDGVVHIKGAGTATITVVSEKETRYTEAKLEVVITVTAGCGKGHSYGDWTQTVAPGCETTGKKTAKCSVCGETKEETIPATGHNFTSDSEKCLNGCGTVNPSYTPPTTEEPTIPEDTTPSEETTP